MPKEKSRRRSSRSSRSSHRRQRQNRSRTARTEPSLSENQEERLLQQGYYPQSQNPMALVLLLVIIQYVGENFVELAGHEAESNGHSNITGELVEVAEGNDSSFFIFYWYTFYFHIVLYQE